jgi:hypothetical protein
MEAFVRLAAYRLGLWLFPVTSVRQRAAVSHWRSRAPQPLDRVAWAIRLAARYVPAATCLTEALALQSLLIRSGHLSTVYIGVAKRRLQFEAHAWVECQDGIVIGGFERDQYTPLVAWEGRL